MEKNQSQKERKSELMDIAKEVTGSENPSMTRPDLDNEAFPQLVKTEVPIVKEELAVSIEELARMMNGEELDVEINKKIDELIILGKEYKNRNSLNTREKIWKEFIE